jgi:hypothetical protein
MAKNFTKTQQEVVLLLQARLDPKNPMFAGSDEVKAALSGEARIYFETWVHPLLNYLATGEEAYYGQAADLRNDFSTRRAAAESRQRAIAARLMAG